MPDVREEAFAEQGRRAAAVGMKSPPCAGGPCHELCRCRPQGELEAHRAAIGWMTFLVMAPIPRPRRIQRACVGGNQTARGALDAPRFRAARIFTKGAVTARVFAEFSLLWPLRAVLGVSALTDVSGGLHSGDPFG